MSQTFSTRYPPKNRKPEGDAMPILRIEIEHQAGVLVFDPSSIIVACHNGEHRLWRPLPDVDSEMSPAGARSAEPSGTGQMTSNCA